MAKDAANDLTYYLVLDESRKSDLGQVRHWSNLKIAFDSGKVWVKGMDYAQVHSVEVKSMPYKTVFYESQGKLFLLNSNLPDRNIPSLLWTAVERALPLRLPSLNHNYFGIEEKFAVKIVPSEKETESVAMIATVENLGKYLQTAPEVRLRNLRWVMLNRDRALILGKPLLPVTGKVYWQRHDHLLPAGSDFDLFLLSETLNTRMDPDREHLIVWNTDGTYFLAEKSSFEPLTLSSYRITQHQLSQAPHEL